MVRDEKSEISEDLQREITSEHLKGGGASFEIWCVPYALLLAIVVLLIVLLFVCQSYKKRQKRRRMARAQHINEEYMSGDSDESLKMDERRKNGKQIVSGRGDQSASYDGKHCIVAEAVFVPQESLGLPRDNSQSSCLHMKLDLENPSPVADNDPWTQRRTLVSPDLDANEFWEKMTSSDL